jgi:hypothetical protein
MLQPLDAIADPVQARCYLVLDAIAASPSLERYLDQGALSEAEVRFVLNQVLQSLESLQNSEPRRSPTMGWQWWWPLATRIGTRSSRGNCGAKLP